MVAVVVSTLMLIELPTVPSVVCAVLAANGTYMNLVCLGLLDHPSIALMVAHKFRLYLHRAIPLRLAY